MAKKRPKKRGCLVPVVRITIFLLFIFAIGFFIFYSLDNPDFLSGLKERFVSGSPEERAAAESFPEETVMVQEASQEPVPEEDRQEGPGFLDTVKELFVEEQQVEEGPDIPARLDINLYYAVLGEDKLMEAEKRTIVAGNRESALINATKELLKGPNRPYLFAVIPGGTSLIDTEIYENFAEVNLSQEFLDNSLDTRMLDELIIYSIVNTLTEIPGIDGVIFYIEGKRIKVYGNIDLSIPAIRKEELIKAEG
ncbi:MAG: GerMN domain-containing protein [Actinomycetota bacterium]